MPQLAHGGEIVAFQTGVPHFHNSSELPDFVARYYRDFLLAYSCPDDLDPAITTVDHDAQPHQVVNAALQGIRPQLQLRELVVRTQLPALQAAASEATRSAAAFFMNRAAGGCLPVDPATIEARAQKPQQNTLVLPVEERIVHAHAICADDYLWSTVNSRAYAAFDGTIVISPEYFLDASGAINHTAVAHTANHELGHQLAGRVAMVDEAGTTIVSYGAGFHQFTDKKVVVHDSTIAEEYTVEDLALQATSDMTGLPTDTVANRYTPPAYRDALEVSEVRTTRPDLYGKVMTGVFDNGADGDVERFLAAKQQTLNIIGSVCDVTAATHQ